MTLIDPQAAVILKPERDKHVRNKHPWVFMGAIAQYPAHFEDGDIVPVLSAQHEYIGYGYFNKGQSISGRMVSFSADEDPLVTIANSITQAVQLRHAIISTDTNAYRLINGEGDNLPGLIADYYNGVVVLQINTLGIEKLKPLIMQTLQETVEVKAILKNQKQKPAARKGWNNQVIGFLETQYHTSMFWNMVCSFGSVLKTGKRLASFWINVKCVS